jgi:signal transduction histidine kinase
MDTGLRDASSYSSPPGNRADSQCHSDCDKRIARLHTLQEVSRKLTSKLDLEDALTSILDEAIQATGAERGCLLLADPATGKLEARVFRHLRLSDLDSEPFRPSRTVIKRVWCDGQAVLTANAAEDPDLAKATSVINYALRSILCVPLHVQGNRIGVLYLDNRVKVGQFEGDDLALALAIADQAAIALRNAQLHQEVVNRARQQMEVLHRIQSLNQISCKVQGLNNFHDVLVSIGEELEQFGYHCTIALLNADATRLEVHYYSSKAARGPQASYPEGKVLTVALADTVICHQALEARNGRFVSNPNEVMAELLGRPDNLAWQPAFVAPLVANNRTLGVLILGLDNTSVEEPSLLMAFANQVATIIEISRLRTELEGRLTEMQSVLAITRAMVSELGLDNLLEFIMVQAEYLTNAEGAAVLLLSDDGQWLEVATPIHSSSRMKAGARLLVRESLPGLAMASQRIQVRNTLVKSEQVTPVRSLLRPVVLRSLMCAPLVARGENLGVLMVWNKRGHVFTQNDSRLIGLFADQAALALQNAHLHARNRQLAVEEERHRLARDLHDSVTQSLYSIALAAQASLKLMDQARVDGEIRCTIEHIQVTSRSALADMRHQLCDLHPTAVVSGGLMEALAQHCAVLREQYALAIEFVAEQEPPLSSCQREALYYIAREALWNAINHAGARRVDVLLTQGSDYVALRIMDNGAGFDPTIFARGETRGLRNIEERANLAGGIFELETGLGHGTRITVRIPI